MNSKKVVVISDTHGLVRPELLKEIEDCDLIIHAGDIGNIDVINKLREYALIRAVRGNIDREEWCISLPKTDVIEFEGKYIYVLHNVEDLDLDPKAAGFDIVIFGHSHKPSMKEEKGVIYLNPGSIGPRRFKLPIAFSIIEFENSVIKHRSIKLIPE